MIGTTQAERIAAGRLGHRQRRRGANLRLVMSNVKKTNFKQEPLTQWQVTRSDLKHAPQCGFKYRTSGSLALTASWRLGHSIMAS